MKNFFEPVRGQNENAASIFLSFMTILFAWIFLASIFVIIPTMLWTINPKPWQVLFTSLIGFVPVLPSFLIVSKILAREVFTFVTTQSRFSFRNFFIGVGSWGSLLLIGTLISFAEDSNGLKFVFDAQSFLIALLVLVILLPIQVASEELIFRGFIPQSLSFFKIPRNLVVLLSALAFAAPHLLNPEAQSEPIWSILAYGSLGFAWLTAARWFGGLEITIGAHLINNFYGLAIVGYENSVLTSSPIFIGPAPQMNSTAIAMWVTVGLWLLMIKRFKNVEAY